MMTGEHSALKQPGHCPPDCRTELAGIAHTERPAIMAYIHRQFAHHYGADVQSFLPWLTGLYQGKALAAAAGFRLAHDERLYLEQYLDAPIEEAIAGIPGLHAERGQIAEIGNLAGTVRHCVRELFVTLACLMQAAGAEVVTCTANPAVRAVFREMKMPFKAVCPAVADRLGTGAQQWGRYYDRRCIVMAVNVNDVIHSMACHYPDMLDRAAPTARLLVSREMPDPHANATH